MKNTLKTYTMFKSFIINSLKYNYSNGLIEGTNNLIKCIKRIAFGFRSFRRFKVRIMICKNLLSMKKFNV